jgi:predicted MFS family arabinose efflux permease
VVAAFSAVGATTQLLWLGFAPITTDAARHYGVSTSAIGWLANVFPLWYVLLALPAGVLLDRRFRTGLTAGAMLTAAGGVVRLTADSYAAVFAGQTLVALAQPLVLTAITGVAGRYLVEPERPKGIAVGSAGTFAGMVAAFVLSAALPLRPMLVVTAVLAVVAAAGLVLALRTPAPFAPVHVPVGRRAVRTAWADPLVQRLCVLVVIPFGTFTALTTWAETLLDPAGVSSDAAGGILVVNIVAGVVGCAVLPVWAVARGRELALMASGVIGTAVGCAVLGAVPGVAVGVLAFAVSGFLLLPALPVVLEMVERRAGAVAGTASGLVWLAGQAGALVVTGGVGLLVDHATTSFAVLGLVTLAALPLLRSLRASNGWLREVPIA